MGWVGVSAGCIHSTEGIDLKKTRVLRVEMSKGGGGGGGGWGRKWTHPHHGHGVAAWGSRL